MQSIEEKYMLDIFRIVAETEKEIDKMFKESSLVDAIKADVVLAKRNMAYNGIKTIIKKYRKILKDERKNNLERK